MKFSLYTVAARRDVVFRLAAPELLWTCPPLRVYYKSKDADGLDIKF